MLEGKYKNPHFDKKHKFVIESESAPGLLEVSQLSQGYQSMLALAMDFARRLAIANDHLDEGARIDWARLGQGLDNWVRDGAHARKGPRWSPAIMLVDEIDLHLHPRWQQRVLGDLIRTFPGTQFVVTTHSPQVLSTVPMESIRIIKEGMIHSGPPGTDGAEAQRILEDVFHVSPRPNTPMAAALDKYLRLVDARQWDTSEALELRRRLDEWSKGNEPRLVEADLEIENMKWETGR
jgi:predicted ATP-binding protein involved in virulence